MGIKTDTKGFKEFQNYLKKISSPKAMQDLKEDIKNYMIKSTVNKITSGNIKGSKTLSGLTKSLKGSSKVLQDTGALRKSIRGALTRKSVLVGSNLIYAAIHNEGGTIKPVKAKHLYIPAFKEVKTRYGSDAFGVSGAINNMKKDGWNIWHTNRAVLGKRKQDTKARVIFFKKKSVEIPQRQYLYISRKDKQVLTKLAIKIWEQAA